MVVFTPNYVRNSKNDEKAVKHLKIVFETPTGGYQSYSKTVLIHSSPWTVRTKTESKQRWYLKSSIRQTERINVVADTPSNRLSPVLAFRENSLRVDVRLLCNPKSQENTRKTIKIKEKLELYCLLKFKIVLNEQFLLIPSRELKKNRDRIVFYHQLTLSIFEYIIRLQAER